MFIGLDGYAKGWVAVRLADNGTKEIDFLTDLKECFDSSFARAMIDIPIGLPDSEYRHCDLEAVLRRQDIPERPVVAEAAAVATTATLPLPMLALLLLPLLPVHGRMLGQLSCMTVLTVPGAASCP